MELQPIGRELPAEVVLLIFERTQPSRSHLDLVPDPFLPKLALLSKSFLGVARRRLYSDVYLTQHGSLSTKDVVRGFLWALQVQPSLSDLVLGIHYGATRVEEDEIRHVSNAISRVDNLLRLRIFGFDQDYSAIMRINEVVQSRRALEEIEISTFSLTEHYSALFCGLAPFFRMLFLWSNIRSVIIHAQTIGWERSTRLGIEEAILGSCARLTRFIYHCAEYWEDKHLEALVRIAPELEELWLRGVLMSEALTREGLETSLTAWSSSLRQLSLHFPNTEREGDAYKRLHLDKVLVQLPELRLLDLGSAYLQPSSLARGASKLASLRLEIRVNEPHTAELKEVLRDAKALPNLKNLRILPDVKLAFQDAADLFTLCAAREISLEIVGDYSDVKKHLNFHP